MNIVDALDWSLLQVFLAAADAGSLSRAATNLGTSQPTVSRRLARLESELGHALFERTPDGLLLTEAGRVLMGPARRVRQRVDQLALALERHAGVLAGTVRITASEAISHHVLLPAVRVLRLTHPQIQVELVPGDGVVDLLRREADVALRMFRPQERALIARRVADVPLGLYAHRDYLARRGPVTLQRLADHDWIGEASSDRVRRGFARAGHVVERTFFAIRTDHSALAWQAVCAGLGVGVGLQAVAARTPGVVRVLPELDIAPLPCWLVVHRELRGSPRLRAAVDVLADAFGTQPWCNAA